MNKLKQIYNELLKAYGDQGWWPIINNNLICEYHTGPPRNESEIFEICVGAILTQNTSWKNVEKAIIQLNKKGMTEIDKILSTPQEELAQLIKSAGYYNQKAKKLKNLALFLKNNPIPKLRELNLIKARELLLKVNGVGPETADSILLYALGKPSFVIDAYTKRIMTRTGFCKETVNYEELQSLFVENLEENLEQYQEYHALLVKLAKNHCKTKPSCPECPLKEECDYHPD